MAAGKMITLETWNSQPLVKVSVLRNQKHIDLKYDCHRFELCNVQGERLFDKILEGCSWRIKVKEAQPAVYEYYLILHESEHLDKSREAFEKYRKQADNVLQEEFGGEIYIEDRKIVKNTRHVILAGPYQSERDARHHSKKYGQLNHCRIYRRLIKEGSGIVEVFDSEYENFAEVEGGVRLVSNQIETFFEIKNFEINHNPERRTHHEDLRYQGSLNIFIDEQHGLSAINEVPVELYLKGVLYSEIGENAPSEYAKSMAIAARSQVYSRFGRIHVSEKFDFCSDSHCLRYYGRKLHDETIEQAISETGGLVLGSESSVNDAHFSYCCGGHTESASRVWLSDEEECSCGRFDGDEKNQKKTDLRKETPARDWILSRPDAYCKLDSAEVPGIKELSQDAFRWEVFYTRNELEEILYEKTGEEPGMIYEIIPLKRGVSGRIKEIEILGSLKNVRVSGELNIRSAFSPTFLNSSCFIVQHEMDQDGVPISFLFVGAGKGHGVGLCKTGAVKLARDGRNAEDILAHYFNACNIKRIY